MPTPFEPMPGPGRLTLTPEQPLLTVEQQRRVVLAREAADILQAGGVFTTAVNVKAVVRLADWLEGTEAYRWPPRPPGEPIWIGPEGIVVPDPDREHDEREPADDDGNGMVVGDVELPGMWEAADLSGGEADTADKDKPS